MTIDVGNAILTGLFVGIGGAGAEWIKEKYIKPALDKTHEKIRGKETDK